ncbi:MAG: ABC transporter permease [Victivallaceae bacterium]|nr:ABC transporter permease [Victivallaceae bacterium]
MKNAFFHIISLGFKEIIGLWRDPLLVFLIIYSFSASVYLGAQAEPDAIDHAAIAIVDEDHSALTKRIGDAFFPPLFRVPEKLEIDEIDDALDAGRYTFVIVFPPNFQERVLANHKPQVQINVDATRMSQAFTGNGYIQEIISDEVDNFVRALHPDVPDFSADIITRNRYNPNLVKAWEGSMNQMANNVAMLALILTGAALIRERERGTLEHLLVTPANAFEIMVSKVWSMSLVVFVATFFSLTIVIRQCLHVPLAGSVGLFMAGTAINLFAMTSLGIFLSCFARDMPQLGILMILVLMPMQILAGGSTSQSQMPIVVRIIMQFAPTTHYVEICRSIIFRGAGIPQVAAVFGKLFLLGCGFFFIALRRFRKTVSS